MDLRGHGEEPDELVVYDYSSDHDDPVTATRPRREGQAGACTCRHVLRFTPR